MNQTSRRTFLSSSLGAAIGGGAPAAPRLRRPNIIVNVMDDQRFDCLSCYEGKTVLDFIRTPNMDRLAAEGVRFRNAFVTFSLCSPSRATMLTGKDVRTHGVNRLALDVQPDCAIFPALLRQAGYETGYAGKWHLGKESDVPDPAFDHWAGVRDQGQYIDPVMNINGSVTKVPGYASEIFMDQALEFQEARQTVLPLARPESASLALYTAQAPGASLRGNQRRQAAHLFGEPRRQAGLVRGTA